VNLFYPFGILLAKWLEQPAIGQAGWTAGKSDAINGGFDKVSL
jgi:hypothetical protein